MRINTTLLMYSRYFYWQFAVAPLWLTKLALNIQLALINFFSVSIMIQTLFAYWHKDSVSYRQGSIGGIFTAIAWNLISRGIGFIIRSVILLLWLCTAVITSAASLFAIILFIVWPLLALLAVVDGVLIISGGGL